MGALLPLPEIALRVHSTLRGTSLQAFLGARPCLRDALPAAWAQALGSVQSWASRGQNAPWQHGLQLGLEVSFTFDT